MTEPIPATGVMLMPHGYKNDQSFVLTSLILLLLPLFRLV